jgi:hypothetical protein
MLIVRSGQRLGCCIWVWARICCRSGCGRNYPHWGSSGTEVVHWRSIYASSRRAAVHSWRNIFLPQHVRERCVYRQGKWRHWHCSIALCLLICMQQDAYLNNGDAVSVILSRFQSLYAKAVNNEFTIDILRQHNKEVHDYSVQNNPYFFQAVCITYIILKNQPNVPFSHSLALFRLSHITLLST